MTTNQTIDGVPRELLQKIADGGYCHQGLMDRLRALLDAPATWECTPCKVEQPTSRPCDVCGRATTPAAQPQGEPVAWQYRIVEDGKPLFNPLKKDGWIDTVEGVAKDMAERPSLSESRHYEVRKLYAEQPAPVAVDRPTYANPPPGAQPCGAHHDNDGLDEMRK